MADELFDRVIADAARKREARREAKRAYLRAWRKANPDYFPAYRKAHPDYDRAPHAADSEAAIYAGRDVVGHILVRSGQITATDANGRRLGTYATDKLAMAAIIANARSGRTP
jgi:hypothetical protein